jgi:hypothetical protein
VDEVYLIVRESKAREERRERALPLRNLRDGRVPGTDDMARARGAIVRERENSIFSDAWLPLAFLMIIIGIMVETRLADRRHIRTHS